MKLEKDTALLTISVTDWEKRAVSLLAEGRSVPDIAAKESSSSRAIEYQLSKLKSKCNCETAAQLVAFFLRNKLID